MGRAPARPMITYDPKNWLRLPFGLVREFRYATIAASMLVFFATMGLELLAVEIEEPFGTDPNDLPTDDIAARAARDAHELLVGAAAAVTP